MTLRSESETERKPEVHASPRGEALFRCARPSGVPTGPATSTGSLASQRHPGKFPKVPVLLSPWDIPGKNTGVHSLSLLQGIFPIQELNWGLLHYSWILYAWRAIPGPLSKLQSPHFTDGDLRPRDGRRIFPGSH